VTILHGAPNADGADKFVAYLLGRDGQTLMKEHGLGLQNLTLTGGADGVPNDVQALLKQAK